VSTQKRGKKTLQLECQLFMQFLVSKFWEKDLLPRSSPEICEKGVFFEVVGEIKNLTTC
jgi:hypothetical protein